MNKRPYLNHIISEVYVKDSLVFEDIELIIKKLEDFVKELNINIVQKTYYKFEPHGYTILFILSTSHLAVHFWPENNYFHFDIVTSKPGLTEELVSAGLMLHFPDADISVKEILY
jgi:S-adenosylmethionine decarboxylase